VLATDRVVYRFYRTQKAKPIIFVIASIGVMFILNGIVRFIIGPDDQRFSDGERFIISARDFKEMTGLDEGLAFRTTQGITVVTAVIVVALLFWFLNRTRTGKSMRAFSDNEDLALLSGINPERVVVYHLDDRGGAGDHRRGALRARQERSSPSPISSFCCRSSPRPSSAGWATRSAPSPAAS
jgi:branched-subunit amino acid ABC-type transport system permease component